MSTSLLLQAGAKIGDISVRISAEAELKGFTSALGVAHFLGVQFARIPARHSGVVDATEYGPICPQPPDHLRGVRQHLFAGAPAANLSQSEYDCLRLNIYAPASAVTSGEKLPVFVWIHGGGWTIENGNADFSGDFLVHHSVKKDKPIVFVSINYRMGSFGFLSSLELTEEALSHGEAGWANQGLNDQRLGLEWVKNYIHLFGGDGSNVTIAGESAGAWSVLAHLRSDQPLCRRGLLQSAPSWSMMKPSEAQAKFDRLVQSAGISPTATAAEKIAALRSASPEDLIAWNGPITFPNWDPKWFALISGTMRDEMSFFGLEKGWSTKASVLTSLRNLLSLPPGDPSFYSEVLAEYGIQDDSPDTVAVQAFGSILADACFSRVPFNLADACCRSNNSASPSLYIYRFDQHDEEESIAGPAAPISCQTTADLFSQMILRLSYGEAPWQEYGVAGARNVFDGSRTRLEIVDRGAQRWRKLLTTQDRVNRFARLFYDLLNKDPDGEGEDE
ncbi:carboxylesterase [Aspergillus spinulosporus]